MVCLNFAEVKEQLADLFERVAYGGETVLITRRGKPMAKLAPPDAASERDHLANVKGWLDDDSPFLAEIDAIVEKRSQLK